MSSTRVKVALLVGLGVTANGALYGEPLSTPNAATVTAQDPQEIVTAIYKRAVVDAKKPRPTSPFFDKKVRATYFSKAFDRMVTASDTKAARAKDSWIDFDPITSAQDAEIGKVSVTTVETTPTKAVVSANFLNFKEPTTVTYDFIREQGAWKIDDIKGAVEKQPWSVRQIVKSLRN